MIGAPTLLQVSTLGRFEVRRHQELLTGGNWSRRKVNDLFKLLLSAEQHRLHREQIQDILWPASSTEQAANSFGKTLYLLRRALEPDLAAGKGSSSVYVLLDHDTLMLIPDSMRIDTDVFESAAKQLQVKMRSYTGKEPGIAKEAALLDEFDAALALYQGDYLPEDLYEDWSQRRRDRLRRIHSWLLENAAELALASGQGMDAREYLQALLERNSADEQTHRQLMLVYARMGRRSEALNQYLALRKALKEELRASPLPETNELFRKIQMGQIPVDLAASNRRGRFIVPSADVSAPDSLAPSLVNEQQMQEARIPTGELVARQEAEGTSSKVGAPLAGALDSLAGALDSPTPAASSQIDPDRILKAELVGREEEISRMQRAYTQTRNGQQRVIFLSGEPGIGKTRLAREFTHWGEETQQATVLWGYCYEMSGLLPYQPIADAINAHARTCSPEKLRNMLGNSAVDLAKIAPEVRFKLPDLPPPDPLGPEAERRNLYSAVARYLNTLALEGPLIIILDDLQWADAATLHLLSFLTLQSGTNPFDNASPTHNAGGVPLYLMLYRADEVHETHPLRGLIASLARGGIGEEVRLQRLTEEQVEQLLVNIAEQPVQGVFVSEIYQQTEGNPFFIGEAIRSLIFEGKIRWTGERWQATVKLSELELPQSVRLLIERRLVQLSPECRTTLTQAAVIGREFSSALLCQALNLSEEIVAEHIDSAIQFQILTSPFNADTKTIRQWTVGSSAELAERVSIPSRPSPMYRPDVDLTFTHDNFREVLYRWLNPLRRRVLHRQVAQAIESRYATQLQPYYSTLAHHYQMAEKPAQAVDYLLKAAYLASSLYAFTDAANYMKTAVDLLIGDAERPRRAALLHQLANIYLFTGYTAEAVKAGLASCALWRDLGDSEKQAETYLDVAFFCHWQGREWDAVKYIQSALECLKTTPQEIYLTAKAYTQWGMAATIMGEIPEALDKLHQADVLHQQIGGNDAFISIVSLWSLSWCAFIAETPRQMLAYVLQAVEVCRTSNKPEWEPMMNYTAAWAYMLLGQLAEGEQAARKALKEAEQLGVVGAQGWANLVLAFLAIQAGRWEEAKQTGDSAYTIATMLNDADLQARVLWSRSMCAGWQGDWERAISEVLEALQVARQEGEILLMVYPHLLVQAAKAHFHAGKPEQAQTYLDQGMQLAQSRRYRQLPAIGLRLQGRIWTAQGKFEEAQPCFEQSLTELLAIDDMVEYARTQEAYGLFYLARNHEDDFERGQSLIKSAQATFERLGVNG